MQRRLSFPSQPLALLLAVYVLPRCRPMRNRPARLDLSGGIADEWPAGPRTS